jgi:hypothetical protein
MGKVGFKGWVYNCVVRCFCVFAFLEAVKDNIGRLEKREK